LNLYEFRKKNRVIWTSDERDMNFTVGVRNNLGNKTEGNVLGWLFLVSRAANLGLAAWVLGLRKYELDYGCMAVASWLFGSVGLLWLGCGLRASAS
jgi:hypothetical protein